MQKWLKMIAVMLVLCLAVCLTGCNKNKNSEDSSDSSSSDAVEDNTPKRKVGYILHGNAEKEGFTAQLSEKRVFAANRCGIETCYIDNVAVTDFEAAVKALADAGCTDIVTGSSVFTNVLSSVSGKFMDLNFISYGAVSYSSNVSPYTEQIYQGANVAGMVATFNSRSRKIGFIADSELVYSIPSINAAALGAQMVLTDAKVYAAIATQDNEIRKAADELLGLGCDVIILYTSSMYGEDYLQNKGVKFISCYDFTGKEDDYSNLLMYYYCKRDSYYLAQFKSMLMATWMPEDYVGTFGNGVVNVSVALPATDEIKKGNQKETQTIMDALVKQLSGNGSIFVGQLDDNTGIVRFMQDEVMTDNQIYAMDWYVKGVEYVGNYRKPLTISPNPLEIKS